MSELPKGWVHQSMVEITTKIGSGSTPRGGQEAYKAEGIPLVRSMNVRFSGIDAKGLAFIDDDQAAKLSAVTINDRDVLLNITGASIGRVSVARGWAIGGRVNQHVCIIRPVFADPLSDYLNYYLMTPVMQQYINSNESGATRQALTKAKIESLCIPLAPLAEQKRIVEKLNEALAQVDTIKARIDGISDLLKRFRQSVLASAVSGRLTEAYGFERSEQFECKLKEVLDITSGIAFKKSQYSEEGSRLLQIANVGYGKAKWDKESFVSLELAQEYKDFCLSDCDLVMALNRPITNGTLKVAKIESNDLPATLYQRVARLRVKEAVVGALSLDYLFFCLRSSEFRKQVEANLKGSDQPYLNTSTLGELVIDTYSHDEQKEIVRLVNQYFDFADTIEAQVKKAQARVDNLAQSILAKAFRGELVPQDPNDEPADKLLERIAKARKEAEALAKAAKKAEAAKKRAAKKATENS